MVFSGERALYVRALFLCVRNMRAPLADIVRSRSAEAWQTPRTPEIHVSEHSCAPSAITRRRMAYDIVHVSTAHAPTTPRLARRRRDRTRVRDAIARHTTHMHRRRDHDHDVIGSHAHARHGGVHARTAMRLPAPGREVSDVGESRRGNGRTGRRARPRGAMGVPHATAARDARHGDVRQVLAGDIGPDADGAGRPGPIRYTMRRASARSRPADAARGPGTTSPGGAPETAYRA